MHCMLTILFLTKAHIVSDPAGPGRPALNLLPVGLEGLLRKIRPEAVMTAIENLGPGIH